MGTAAGAPEDRVESILRALPRHPAPEIALEAILGRMRARARRKAVVLGIGGAFALALAWVARMCYEPAPPVHLEIRVVDLVRADAAREPVPLDVPAEMTLP